MAKTINLEENVAALCDEYPELVDILVGLGFKPLANPVMRKMAGSHMTIPKASGKMGIPMDQILFALAGGGFAVTGLDSASESTGQERQTADHAEPEGQDIPENSEDEKKRQAREPGHVFLARMGKTRLRPGGIDATTWLLDQVNITADTKILEVACNMGTTLIQIAEKTDGCRLTGLDLDQNALDHAEANVRQHHLEDRVTLVHGSAFELPFPDNCFDIVINEAMLTMLLGEQKDQAIAEYHRVLKPGGVLLTQDVLLRTEEDGSAKEIISGISRAINVHVEPLTASDWVKKFSSHGFTVKTTDGPMTLLDPDGMKHDEGDERTHEILLNALKSENADFFDRMFRFFNTHKDQLGYIAAASTKSESS